jgi:hypothetical protein
MSEDAVHRARQSNFRGWENGCFESINGEFRNELLNREVVETLIEANVLIEGWCPGV